MKKQMRRILALDLGANLGLCDLIISSNGNPAMSSKVVKLREKELGKRLVEFERVLRTHTTFVTELVVETPIARWHTAIKPLFAYLGILYKWAAENNVEIFEYNPIAIKAFAARTGKASKDEMVRAANRLMGIKTITNNNEADAVCLMYLHLYRKNISVNY